MTFKTADLSDEFGDEIQICEILFQSYGAITTFMGPISTLRVFEDNVKVREALTEIEPGSVLVVDGGGSLKCALLGDQLAAIAESRNIAGVIINGAVRDVAELKKTQIGILAIGSNPKKSKKYGAGERGVPLFLGGIHWHPGDFVYVDEDGVVISKVKR